MRNILMALVVANILYWMWGRFVEEPAETGIVVVDESELGPPLKLNRSTVAEAAASVGAVLGTGKPSDLAAVVGRSCVSLGPFKTNMDADVALSEYRADGMRASMRTTEGQVFVGHWVQIRNIPNREEGNAMLDKLREGGLGDAYLVPTEEDGLKISLGLFGEKSRAERVELQAKSMDLPADITPRMRDATVFFVDIGLPPGKGAGDMIERYGEDLVLLRNQATCPRSE
ncbi:MAG: SPOR domain-containing protein [Gammaproteobacteria bacterium]|nr:SPOR domain-containing protein [Gammaproteobacteria bacterium]